MNEDFREVLNIVKQEVFRDMRVCTLAYVVNVEGNKVDVQPSVKERVGKVEISPPVVKGLYVVGDRLPDVNDVGVILHFDRKNKLGEAEMQVSGGVAHEIGYGVFLPVIKQEGV